MLLKSMAAAGFALLASGCVASMTVEASPPAREAIVPAGMERARDDYHYSPAVRAGDFIFVSGVVAGRRPGEDSDEPGFDRAIANVGRVLEAAGADWSDVVEMTTYHTDLPAQFETFSRAKDRVIPAPPYPAWTAIDVDRLLPDGGIVEIRVTAYAPRD